MTNLESMTLEEIDAKIHELELKREAADNMQMALKIFINSAYGAMANKYFMFYNSHVAEAVTTQGRHLITSTRDQSDKYAHEKWHKDVELHKKLGIEDVQQISEDDQFTIYSDTDSNFYNFEPFLKSCDYKGDSIEFILKFDEYRFKNFMNNWHDHYAKKYGVTNVQEFEFEKLAYNAIWCAKKNYSLNLAMKDGKRYDRLTKINHTGIKIVRSSTPAWIKDKLHKFLIMLYDNDGEVEYNDLISTLIQWKKEYRKSNLNDIAELSGISDYKKYVISDCADKPLELASGVPKHIRAAANYNYYLNNNQKLKKKYELIHSGDKVRYYDSKSNYDLPDDVFGFIVNEYPYEFAPDFNYDAMFNKWMIDQINIFLKAMNMQLIPKNLTRVKKLF